jgi:hypothetical protein
MEHERRTGEQRKPYKKPSLRTIDLAAEEVLGTGCKTGGETAVAVSTCIAGGCSGMGS